VLIGSTVNFYATAVEVDDEGFITHLEVEESEKLTARQLRHALEQKYTFAEKKIAREGMARWNLEYRPLHGRLRNSKGPGECYHIDATRANVYLVNRLMRTRVAGRPWIFTLCDDFSGLTAGVHVCFESPSWQAAMMALINAVSPKVPFCADLGIEITEDRWAAYRFPESILTDQQFRSVHYATILHEKYLVNWTGGVPYRPDLRSVSERPFLTQARIWEPFVSGVVEKDDFGRGKKHPAMMSSMTLPEFTEVVVRAILVKNDAVIRGFSVPPEMVERGWAGSPNNLWAYGEEVNGCGRVVNLVELRKDIMPAAMAVLTKSGLELNQRIYDLPRKDLEQLQSYARAHSEIKGADVRFDWSNDGAIELVTKDGLVKCKLSDRNGPAVPDGVSALELYQYRQKNKKNAAKAENDSQALRAQTQLNIELRGKLSRKATKAALKEAGLKHVDVSDIRGAARDEELTNLVAETLIEDALYSRSMEEDENAGGGADRGGVVPSGEKVEQGDARRESTGREKAGEPRRNGDSGPRKTFVQLQEEAALRILKNRD
jgi:hypothetical protein